jgi:hypothetical protein
MQHMFNSIERHVEDNCLQSSDLPPMRVQFAKHLEYLGNLKSTIYNTSTIDNYYFAERDEKGIIQVVVYLQFESNLPDVDLPHDYPNLKAIQLGNLDFGYDGGVRTYHQSRIDEQPADSDIAQTVAFLKQKGVQFQDGEFYGTLRFVHLTGEDKRDEVSILYLERLQEADIPPDVVAKSRNSDEWPNFCEDFLARALRSFKVCKE